MNALNVYGVQCVCLSTSHRCREKKQQNGIWNGQLNLFRHFMILDIYDSDLCFIIAHIYVNTFFTLSHKEKV